MTELFKDALRCLLLLIAIHNCPLLVLTGAAGDLWPAVIVCGLLFVLLNIFPTMQSRHSLRLRILWDGTVILRVFLATTVVSILVFFGVLIFADYHWKQLLIYGLLIFAGESLTFWNGIIRVYCTSVQLGIKWRVIGAACGLIPVVQIIVLLRIIRIVRQECIFEEEKLALDARRADQRICETKYPLLLVHGVFFRDSRFFNYWGRIPAALTRNGAAIYYGEQESASSVADSAVQLAEKIQAICQTTGCGKVNIIAHSKGGLDSRYAISKLGMDQYVASLTTVNTPHRGCEFAEYLLDKAPEGLRQSVAATYNETLKRLGDKDPDFLEAVEDLTASRCEARNLDLSDAEGVYYQSVGSLMKTAVSGKFPLNLSYHLVKYFDGDNDGLVSRSSMEWGQRFILVDAPIKRGVSHGDIIDLNRENIIGFDVREFYVNLVQELKKMGL